MRLGDWRLRLAQWAMQRDGEPFAWGVCDCAIVCVEAFDAMTGGRLAGTYRWRYRTQRQALRFQRREHVDLQVVLERHGVFRWQGAPLLGDLLIHPHPEWPFKVGHVCFGDRSITAREDEGFCLVETSEVMAMPGAGVWRIA